MQKRTPLYVRLPHAQAEQLDRAAFELKTSKQELVTRLIAQHVPSSQISAPRRGFGFGHHDFVPDAVPEVLTPAQAAELLQVGEDVVVELADAKQLPGRQVGGEWRFAREALLRWLAQED
jgi:excisionase family DNA binding protein